MDIEQILQQSPMLAEAVDRCILIDSNAVQQHPLIADIHQTPLAVRTLSQRINDRTLNTKGVSLLALQDMSPRLLRLIINENPSLPGGIGEQTAMKEIDRADAVNSHFQSVWGEQANAVVPFKITPIEQVKGSTLEEYLHTTYVEELAALVDPEHPERIFFNVYSAIQKYGFPVLLKSLVSGVDYRVVDALSSIIGEETFSAFTDDFTVNSLATCSSALPTAQLEWTISTSDNLTTNDVIQKTFNMLAQTYGVQIDTLLARSATNTLQYIWTNNQEGLVQVAEAFIQQILRYMLTAHAGGFTFADSSNPKNGGSLISRNVTLGAQVMDLITAEKIEIGSDEYWSRVARDWNDFSSSLIVLSRLLGRGTWAAFLPAIERSFNRLQQDLKGLGLELPKGYSFQKLVTDNTSPKLLLKQINSERFR